MIKVVLFKTKLVTRSRHSKEAANSKTLTGNAIEYDNDRRPQDYFLNDLFQGYDTVAILLRDSHTAASSEEALSVGSTE